MHPSARGYVESKTFAETKSLVIKKLGIDDKLFDSLVLEESLTAAVAVNPERYPLVPGTDIRVVHTIPGQIPGLRLAYTFDDEKIYLLHCSEDSGEDEDF